MCVSQVEDAIRRSEVRTTAAPKRTHDEADIDTATTTTTATAPSTAAAAAAGTTTGTDTPTSRERRDGKKLKK